MTPLKAIEVVSSRNRKRKLLNLTVSAAKKGKAYYLCQNLYERKKNRKEYFYLNDKSQPPYISNINIYSLHKNHVFFPFNVIFISQF